MILEDVGLNHSRPYRQQEELLLGVGAWIDPSQLDEAYAKAPVLLSEDAPL